MISEILTNMVKIFEIVTHSKSENVIRDILSL